MPLPPLAVQHLYLAELKGEVGQQKSKLSIFRKLMEQRSHACRVLACAQVDFESIISDSEHDKSRYSDPPVAAQLPCYAVDGFGHYRYNPNVDSTLTLATLLEWPPVWAAVIVDETLGAARTVVCFSAEDARDEAQGMAARLLVDQDTRRRRAAAHEVSRFNMEIASEYTAHGSMSQAGALALAPMSCEARFLAIIIERQREFAYDVLLATESGLKSLPLQIRGRIYAHAYSSRATLDASFAQQRNPDMIQVQVTAWNGYPGDPPWSGLPSTHWIMSVSSKATINDVKQSIHAHIWSTNTALPPEDRLSEHEMKHLRMEWGGALREHAWAGARSYLLGAQSFSRLAHQLPRERDGLLMLCLFV